MSHLTATAHRDALAAGRFVRVVNYHATPRSGRDGLRDELARYAKRFANVSFAELAQFVTTGRWANGRPGFIPVFYEGYRTCYDVAAAVCDELGLSALFPICTGFIDCAPAEQELFARSHHIGLTAEDLARPGERIALSWDEVAELSQRHTVTPHTASHSGIADVATDADFEREVFEPKRKMDAVTGQSAPAFAWLHGTQWGMSKRHDRALQEAGYRFLISNTMIHKIA